MKTILSLSALLITLTLTAQSNTATWYLNNTSGNGIQSPTSTASGNFSNALGFQTIASGEHSTTLGVGSTASGDSSTAMGEGTTASGDYSTAMGEGTTASGDYSTAMGDSTTASGLVSTAMVYQTEASGDYSTAMGFQTTASGLISTAMGYLATASGSASTAMGVGTTASGGSSTAMGGSTTASGSNSTAMGAGTEASGGSSTAMGFQTTASDYASFVTGQYNLLGSTVTNSATDFSLENTAFVIGNGADADNRSDALTVLFDGTTNVAGSVTATEFIGDGSQLTNLSVSSPFSLNDTSGDGIQTFGAYAIGSYSLAMGDNATSSGFNSRALGIDTRASGNYSTSMGRDTEASGNFSTAIGFNTDASGYFSTALGADTTASGNFSTAMGSYTTASGGYSTAMGYETTASDRSSLVIGQYNSSGSSVTSADLFSTSAPAFVIGNGTASDATSDAFKVMFNGDTTVSNDLDVKGNVTVGDVSVLSDARLKANIISLGSTLAKLLQIDGKTYTMKKDENKKQKIGVLAQDIEKVFPELVSESNGVKSVNYQGLVPVLINALKEQDNKINEQEARIERLEKLLLNS